MNNIKIVYSRWLQTEKGTFPFPNGSTEKFFLSCQELVKRNNLNPYGDFDRIAAIDEHFFYNNSNSNFYFRNSNFYYHCKKNNIKFVTESEINGDDEFLYPLEIECNTIQYILNSTEEYCFLSTLSDTLLDLLRKGHCKIILVNMVDPSENISILDKINDFFVKIGINEIYLLQGNCIKKQYKNLKIFDSIISLYQTANEMEKYPYQTALGYVSDYVREIKNVKREKKFLSFNRFLHRPHRTGLAHVALSNNMLEQGYFSFLYCPSENYSDLLSTLNLPTTNADRIKNMVPYQLDTHHLSTEELPRFFTVTNFLRPLYENSYIHIVTETQFEEAETPFFSEKVWRPILNLQPFIMMGNPGSLKKLKELGFKTFSPFIDETYDNILDNPERFSLIEKELIKLNRLGLDEIHSWFMSIEDILIHNQHLLYSYRNYNPLCNLLNSNSYTQIG